ncbi:MAG: hypothetical protein KF882_00975 [Bacteroidia bacterium]|nr:hypothetical protein [Bacteroidia bacterium]MCO5252967.1 hypothetical protein [Bacteroidota bacterium]
MKKLLLLLPLLALLSLQTHGQCVPNACQLAFTNMIDCEVELEIDYSCPPDTNLIRKQTITLNPGSSSFPTVTHLSNYNHLFPCDCSTIIIKNIRVIRIGSTTHNITLSATPSVFIQNSCCNENYGTYSGCYVTMWMTCP